MVKSPEQKIQTKASSLLPILLISVVSFAVYSNAIPNGFIYDDHSQILKNTLIRDVRNIPEMFRRSVWTFEGAPPVSNYYRPLVNVFYLVAFQLSGTEPWGYHLLNVLFHAANSVLVFLIASGLLGGAPLQAAEDRPLSSSSLSRRMTTGIMSAPLIAALLFAAHPIHTEAVTWIAGSSDVSFAFFYFLSFYFYVLSGENYGWRYGFSVLSFLLSVLCKEPGLTLPGILAAYDYGLKRGRLRTPELLKRYVPYVVIGGLYLVARSSVLGGFTPLKRLASLSAGQLIINIFPLFGQYMQKLLLPINLNFWPVFEPMSSLLSAEGMASLGVTILFAGLVTAAYKRNRLVFFCLVFLIVPLVPAFYIKGIVGKPFADRYLYVPSFGFVMLPAILFSRLKADLPQAAKILAGALVLLTGMYAYGTIDRNEVWKDEYSLFADTVRKSPESVVPRLEFGNALLARGRFDEAIEQYRAALTMEPGLYVIYHHLGLAYAGKNELYQAIQHYRTASALNPGAPEIHTDLGRAYAKAGLRQEAVVEFSAAVSIQPTAANHNLLGIALAQMGQLDKAYEAFRIAVSLHPAEESYRRNLSEVTELERSGPHPGDREGGFSGKMDRMPPSEQDIFRFAW